MKRNVSEQESGGQEKGDAKRVILQTRDRNVVRITATVKLWVGSAFGDCLR